jgi:hypothetical protein
MLRYMNMNHQDVFGPITLLQVLGGQIIEVLPEGVDWGLLFGVGLLVGMGYLFAKRDQTEMTDNVSCHS